jgi:hypothetical protein
VRRALLAAAWLAGCLAAVFSQSLSFPQGLQPYRFNPILVQGLAPQTESQILVTGALLDGREIALFTGAGTPEPGGALRCLAYLDEEITALRVRIRRAAGNTLELAVPVEASGPRISVYGAPEPLRNSNRWIAEASSPQQLRPGDIRVLPQGSETAALRAAGIHVLMPGLIAEETLGSSPAWQGYRLQAPILGAAALTAILEKQQDKLLAFKERYRELVIGASFHAPRIDREAPLVFPPATPAGIAHTLHREILDDSVGPLYRYALLGFCLPLLAGVALMKRRQALLALAGFLLAGFLTLTLLAPPQLRSLTVELALPDAQERGISLERVFPETPKRYQYRQRGIPPGTCTLVYRAFLAPGGEVPIQPFAREELLRFNQLPEVRQERGRLFLRSPSPLSAWSLHEPE